MAIYEVEAEQTFNYTIQVEASSGEEAKEKVRKMRTDQLLRYRTDDDFLVLCATEIEL